MPFIAVVGESVHYNGGAEVWRGDEALSLAYFEAHAFLEDDGEEIGDSVGAGSGEAEERGEAPDLQVCCVAEVFCPVESGYMSVFEFIKSCFLVLLFRDCIVSILLDPRNNKVGFFLGQELQTESFGGFLGKVYNQNVGSQTEQACD